MWKPVKNFEAFYEVSDSGVVRSLNYRGQKNVIKELKATESRGYLMVSLHDNKKSRSCSIHRLVAETFIPNPNNYPTVNHKDGNRSNNNVDNLEWLSYSENNKHSFTELGRKSSQDGKKYSLSKCSKKVRCYSETSDYTYESLSQARDLGGYVTSGICRAIKLGVRYKNMNWEYV